MLTVYLKIVNILNYEVVFFIIIIYKTVKMYKHLLILKTIKSKLMDN